MEHKFVQNHAQITLNIGANSPHRVCRAEINESCKKYDSTATTAAPAANADLLSGPIFCIMFLTLNQAECALLYLLSNWVEFPAIYPLFSGLSLPKYPLKIVHSIETKYVTLYY